MRNATELMLWLRFVLQKAHARLSLPVGVARAGQYLSGAVEGRELQSTWLPRRELPPAEGPGDLKRPVPVGDHPQRQQPVDVPVALGPLPLAPFA
jgi:hypothetical protein